MAIQKKYARVIDDIRKKYGKVINLEKSPMVLIEILRAYGKSFDDDGGGGTSTVAVGISPGTGGGGGTGSGGTGTGGTGTGGTSPGTSTVAVGITPPSDPSERVEIEEILRIVLKLQKQVSAIGKQLERLERPG